MYLLDSDTFSLYVLGDENVTRRIEENRKIVWLSSVAAEEQLRGRMSAISRAHKRNNSLSLPQAHEFFAQALEDLRYFPVFVYSDAAEAIFNTFPPAIIRIGAQDCRIAAQALAHGMTVITRNIRHFEPIGAPCMDWGLG